ASRRCDRWTVSRNRIGHAARFRFTIVRRSHCSILDHRRDAAMPRAASTADRWFRLDDFARDVRFSLRAWRRRPAFAIVVIATLAVAIGAVVAVFSVVEAVLLRPLPYADAGRLVAVWDGHLTDRSLAKIFPSYADFETWQRESRTMDQLAAVTWATGD